MKSSLLIKVVCGLVAVSMLSAMAGCKKTETESTASVPTESKTESTASILVPVEATFDEKYTNLLPVKEGESINVKGNVAVKVEKGQTKQYDPNILEGITIDGEYTLSNGIGLGNTCAEFMEFFGITRGYYMTYDKKGQAVDVETESKESFTFVAILKFDEATKKMSYVPGGKVGEHVEGLYSASTSYLSNAGIGNDILLITLTVKGNLTVEKFDIAHYII